MTETRTSIERALCNRRSRIVTVFTVSSFFTVIQLPYLFVVDPNSATYVVSVLNLLVLGPLVGLSGFAIRLCSDPS